MLHSNRSAGGIPATPGAFDCSNSWMQPTRLESNVTYPGFGHLRVSGLLVVPVKDSGDTFPSLNFNTSFASRMTECSGSSQCVLFALDIIVNVEKVNKLFYKAVQYFSTHCMT